MADLHKRRLRISSIAPWSTEGHTTTIKDVDTGEHVQGICKIVLTLEAGSQNTAEVTYYELGDKGGVMVDGNGDPIKHTTTVENVEIDDITAFELMDDIRREYGCNTQHSNG